MYTVLVIYSVLDYDLTWQNCKGTNYEEVSNPKRFLHSITPFLPLRWVHRRCKASRYFALYRFCNWPSALRRPWIWKTKFPSWKFKIGKIRFWTYAWPKQTYFFILKSCSFSVEKPHSLLEFQKFEPCHLFQHSKLDFTKLGCPLS